MAVVLATASEVTADEHVVDNVERGAAAEASSTAVVEPRQSPYIPATLGDHSLTACFFAEHETQWTRPMQAGVYDDYVPKAVPGDKGAAWSELMCNHSGSMYLARPDFKVADYRWLYMKDYKGWVVVSAAEFAAHEAAVIAYRADPTMDSPDALAPARLSMIAVLDGQRNYYLSPDAAWNPVVLHQTPFEKHRHSARCVPPDSPYLHEDFVKASNAVRELCTAAIHPDLPAVTAQTVPLFCKGLFLQDPGDMLSIKTVHRIFEVCDESGMWRTKPFLAYNASELPIELPDIARQLRNETVVVYFNLIHYNIQGSHTIHAEFEGLRVIGMPRPTPKKQAVFTKDPFSPRKKARTTAKVRTHCGD